MQPPIRPALALALTLVLGAVACGQGDADAAADPEPAAGPGSGWLCFAVAVAAVGGLYVVVRRREREIEADRRRGGGPESAWYCRACDRDLIGQVCPRCGTANPFLQEAPDPEARTRPGGAIGRGRGGERRTARVQRPREGRDAGPL
jgi:hypothetical protein